MPERAPATFYLAILGVWLIFGVAYVVSASGGPVAWLGYGASVGLLVLDAVAYIREGGEFAYFRFMWTMCVAIVPPLALAQSLSG